VADTIEVCPGLLALDTKIAVRSDGTSPRRAKTPVSETQPREFTGGGGPGGFAVSVVVAPVMIRDQQLKVLLVERREEPFRGYRALPSGFVRRGGEQPDESLEDAARRVFAEGTGIELAPVYLAQLGAYDPRGDSLSVAYLAVYPHGTGRIAGRISSVGRPEWDATSWLVGAPKALPFDHGRIRTDAARRTIELVETTGLGLAFCHEWFTIADLRHIYENIWDLPADSLDAGNFHHRVMGLRGLVEPVSEDELAAKAAWDRETERRQGIMATPPEPEAVGRGRRARKYKRGPLIREKGPAAPLERPFLRPRRGDQGEGQ